MASNQPQQLPVLGNNGNATNDTTPRFVFLPISHNTRGTLFGLFCFIGVAGVIGNGLLIAVLHRKRVQEKRRPRIAFQRNSSTMLLANLAVSNFLQSLGALAVHCPQLYLNLYTSDWACLALRFPVYGLSCITGINLMMISVERYCAIRYPFTVPSDDGIKKLLAGAWAGGLILGGAAISSVRRVPESLGPSKFTFTCKPDPQTPLSKVLNTGIPVLSYFIGSVLFIYVSLSIGKYMRSRKRHIADGRPQFLDRNQAWRLKETSMSLKIILTFAIPFLGHVLYRVALIVLNQVLSELPFENSLIIRQVTGLFVLANCVTIPLACFLDNKAFRNVIKSLFCARKCRVRVKRHSNEDC